MNKLFSLFLVAICCMALATANTQQQQVERIDEDLVSKAEAIVNKNAETNSLLQEINAVVNHQAPDLTIDHSPIAEAVADEHSLLESKGTQTADAAAAQAAADAASIEAAAASLSAEEMAIMNTDHASVEAEAEAASEAHTADHTVSLAETEGCASQPGGCGARRGVEAARVGGPLGRLPGSRRGRHGRRHRRNSLKGLKKPFVLDGSAKPVKHRHYHHHYFGKGKANRVTVERANGKFVTPAFHPHGHQANRGTRRCGRSCRSRRARRAARKTRKGRRATIVKNSPRVGRRTRRSFRRTIRKGAKHHHHHYHHHDLGAIKAAYDRESRLIVKAKGTLGRLDRKHVELSHALKALDAARAHIRTQISKHKSTKSARRAEAEAERKALQAEQDEIESERERRRQWREKLMMKREKRQMSKWYKKHFGRFNKGKNQVFAHHHLPKPVKGAKKAAKKGAKKAGKKAGKKAKKAGKKGKKAGKKAGKKSAKKAGKKGKKGAKKAVKKAGKKATKAAKKGKKAGKKGKKAAKKGKKGKKGAKKGKKGAKKGKKGAKKGKKSKKAAKKAMKKAHVKKVDALIKKIRNAILAAIPLSEAPKAKKGAKKGKNAKKGKKSGKKSKNTMKSAKSVAPAKLAALKSFLSRSELITDIAHQAASESWSDADILSFAESEAEALANNHSLLEAEESSEASIQLDTPEELHANNEFTYKQILKEHEARNAGAPEYYD